MESELALRFAFRCLANTGPVNDEKGIYKLAIQPDAAGNVIAHPKRDPRWAPGRFCSFGLASTTFVHLYTLYMYCT